MRLFIAEKPSMGREIAKCLKGPYINHNGYIETKEGLVTWAYGHILRLFEPEDYDENLKLWKEIDLPILPKKWQMMVDEKAKTQFQIIKKLIEKATEIVHAGDPDREGQLLIDEILDFLDNKKPVKRILLNALDEDSIKYAIENLKNNEDFQNLKLSALARARADWLMGMNLSRAFTLASNRSGKKGVWPIGRVKTPTLALVVRREEEVENFKATTYYTIKGFFEKDDIVFSGTFKANELQKGLDPEGRLVDKNELNLIQHKLLNSEDKLAIVEKYEKKKMSENPPLPFSLSTLQILAGKKFGYDPKVVLNAAQSLYEKTLTTYPRSDCEYLPENQHKDAKTIVDNIIRLNDSTFSPWAKNADITLKSKAFDDKKISAHHGIIPTTVMPDLKKLSHVEINIYKLIMQAYIAQFYKPHTYEQTKIQLKIEDEIFNVSGKVVIDLGFKILYRLTKEEEKDNEKDSNLLPKMKKGDLVNFTNLQIDEKQTKPPLRFTASTLLAAMKDIHKFVQDVDIKKKLKDIYGIGTEATRAGIIDDLIKRKLLITKNNGSKKAYLHPTNMANMIIKNLPKEMTYPDSTALWEDYLHNMAKGSGTLEEFIAMQEDFTKKMCSVAKNTVIKGDKENPCPQCRKGILVSRKGKHGDFFGCSTFPICRYTSKNMATSNNKKAATPDYEDNFFNDDMISAASLIYNEKYNKGKNDEDKSSELNVTPEYTCPHCNGKLKKVKGSNGYFWSCSSYPRCTKTFDDVNNKPQI